MSDGAYPQAPLTYANGRLYGTTPVGGNAEAGTAFRMSADGVVRVLHNFGGVPDGSAPDGRLIGDFLGNIFGTTVAGGEFDYGTIFRLDDEGTETVLYSFSGGQDGKGPFGGLVRDKEGDLFGAAAQGGHSCNHGTSTCGTIFMLNPQ